MGATIAVGVERSPAPISSFSPADGSTVVGNAKRKWTSEWFRAEPADHPTLFEQEVQRLGLEPADYETSSHLREWCASHKDRRYVPEWLLKRWRMTVNPELTRQ